MGGGGSFEVRRLCGTEVLRPRALGAGLRQAEGPDCSVATPLPSRGTTDELRTDPLRGSRAFYLNRDLRLFGRLAAQVGPLHLVPR